MKICSNARYINLVFKQILELFGGYFNCLAFPGQPCWAGKGLFHSTDHETLQSTLVIGQIQSMVHCGHSPISSTLFGVQATVVYGPFLSTVHSIPMQTTVHSSPPESMVCFGLRCNLVQSSL